jgi:hypothetical protein
VIALLAGCTWQGLDAWSDDFEAYGSYGDLLADDGEDGWSEQITDDRNEIALTDEVVHSGIQAVRFEAVATDGGASKASLFVNDFALLAGTTVAISAWYWLEAGEQPVLMDLEETVVVGAGPGMRLMLDEEDRVWVERKKYLKPSIRQEGEGVAFPRRTWVELRLEVALRQDRHGEISLFQDGERIAHADGVQTLPTDWTYAIQGTRGLYTNAEFGLTAAGRTDALLYLDDVTVDTLDR